MKDKSKEEELANHLWEIGVCLATWEFPDDIDMYKFNFYPAQLDLFDKDG